MPQTPTVHHHQNAGHNTNKAKLDQHRILAKDKISTLLLVAYDAMLLSLHPDSMRMRDTIVQQIKTVMAFHDSDASNYESYTHHDILAAHLEDAAWSVSAIITNLEASQHEMKIAFQTAALLYFDCDVVYARAREIELRLQT